MKKVTLLLTVLFSFCAVNTAFAEEVSAKHNIENPTNKTIVCGRCGEAMSAYQHCVDTDCTGLCSPMAEENELDPILLTQAKELLQADREAHGGYARHSFAFYYLELKEAQAENAAADQNAQAAQKHYCIYCGEEIDRDNKPCPECGEDLNTTKKNDTWPAPKDNALTKRLGRAVAVAEVSAKHKIENPTNKTIVCGRCGEEMSAYQHCVDTDYTGLCSPIVEENELDPILLEQAEELLQADREAHGGYPRHSLEFYYLELKEAQAENAAADQNAQAAQKHYCIYCGEEIDRDNKPCPQSNGLQTCRSTCPECGEDLNTTKNLVKNIHYCKFKGKYPIHPNTMKMITK